MSVSELFVEHLTQRIDPTVLVDKTREERRGLVLCGGSKHIGFGKPVVKRSAKSGPKVEQETIQMVHLGRS
jgi:hypothetical protein